MASTSTATRQITVHPPADTTITRAKGDHWNENGKGFINPWPSAQKMATGFFGFFTMMRILYPFLRQLSKEQKNDPDRANFANLVKQVKPDFGKNLSLTQVKATWLSHASFLVEMPAAGSESGVESAGVIDGEGKREGGVKVLFDPAYSDRCSPVQWWGNQRYSPPPAPVADLPEVDIIAISHNHYDHCDLLTLAEIYKKHADRPPILFVGLKGGANLRSTVGPKTQIVEMDWWEDREVVVEGKGRVRVTCTPCQHSCARTPFDRDQSLWASWAIHSLDDSGSVTGASAWHAGDTGYCKTNEETHTIDPSLPVCPAFAEIGAKLGPFSMGMIPIGAYAPRKIMSTVHNAPIDAVRMFKDTRCKKAIGMHWGTWRMALDRVAEPPDLLVDARQEVGLTEEEFDCVALGETRGYDP